MPSKADILSDFVLRINAQDGDVPAEIIEAAEKIGTEHDELHVLRELSIALRGLVVRAYSAANLGKPVTISVSQSEARELAALFDLAIGLALDEPDKIAKAMAAARKEIYG